MLLDTPFRAGAIALLAAIAGLDARPSQAAAPGYEIQIGAIESDNVERLATGGTSATIAFEELGFDWHDRRPWLDVDIDTDVSHLEFFPHTYSDEFIGNLLGAAKLHLVPDMLSWDISDNFGQAPLQPLAPVTPANRENINYFSTGPELTLPLGGATELDASAAYGRVNFQTSPLDSTRLTGAVGLLHRVSQDSSISVTARDTSIRFSDEQVNPDYEKQEAFARFEAKGSRTELGVDLGYNRLVIPGLHDSNPLAQLNVSRRVSPTSTVGVAFGHAYSDGADSFRLVQTVGGATLNTQPIVVASAPFTSNYATLAWNYKYLRTSLDLSASYLRDRYLTDATLDNERTLVTAQAARQVTPVVRLALTEYLVRWQFDSSDTSATESDTGLQLTWRAGPHLSVYLAYFLAKGSSNLQSFQYTENRIWLSVGYGRAAEAAPGPARLRLPGRDQ